MNRDNAQAPASPPTAGLMAWARTFLRIYPPLAPIATRTPGVPRHTLGLVG